MNHWIKLFNQEQSLCANETHKNAHYLKIAKDIISYIPSLESKVLDYCCGEACFAEMISKNCRNLYLMEPAPLVLKNIKDKFTSNPKIITCSPEDITKNEREYFDLIIMHSAAQYMNEDEINNAFKTIRRIISPSGIFIVGDIINPNTSVIYDVLALLKFGLKEKFFFAAIFWIIKTYFSNYKVLRNRYGLKRYTDSEIIFKFEQNGFQLDKRIKNIGHHPFRKSYLLKVK